MSITPRQTLDENPSSEISPEEIGIYDLVPLNSLEFMVCWQSASIPLVSIVGKVNSSQAVALMLIF